MSKKIYPSKYTDSKVTDAQYLCDEIMERIAAKEKTSLPYKYWNDSRWKKIFLRQIGEANKLLKEVDCVSVMTFLRSPKGRKIFSLGLKKQIIEGSKLFTTKIVEQIQSPEVFVDEFIEDIPPEEESEEPIKQSKKLWESL